MALEGMKAKNAFIVVLCCLIPSGMHSLCPFDQYGCSAGPGAHICSWFCLHSPQSPPPLQVPGHSLGLSPSSLSSHPLLKVGPKLQTTNSPAPCPADWSHHFPQSCPIWVKGNLLLLYSGLPVKFPAPQIQELNI